MRLAATIVAAAAGAAALGGCGTAADDPANPPRLGDWEISRKAVNLSRNGTGVSRNDHDSAYLRSGASPANNRTVCTEPKLADKEWLADHVGSQLGRTCRITEASQSGASARGKGICGEGERGDSRPNETSFHYYAGVTPDGFNANVEVAIRTDLPSGAAEVTAMTVKVEGTRKGNCGGGSAGTFQEG